jgi:hypothetical protein
VKKTSIKHKLKKTKKTLKMIKNKQKNTQTDTTSPFNILNEDIVKALLNFNVIVLISYNKGIEILRVLYKDSINKLKLNIN